MSGKIKKTENPFSGILKKIAAVPPRTWFAAAACIAVGTCFVLLAKSGGAPDFVILTLALLGMCGLFAWDIFSRRRWERDMADRIRHMASHHDRLVREVARNRSDIAILKDGLSDMASGIEAQGRRLLPSTSIEARMIETLVSRLGALGERPRARVETMHDAHILELEIAPPPLKPPPLSEIDLELSGTPKSLSDDFIRELLHHAVRDDRIDIFAQPIVNLPQRRPRMYEVFARIRAGAGESIPASRYMEIARKEQLVPALDNALLLRALHILRERKKADSALPDAPCILNISAATLSDRTFMNDLVAFLSQNRKMAADIIFEIRQAELEGMEPTMIPVLDGMAKLGLRFSMDRVQRRSLDVNLLKSRRVRFIKMDAAWVIREGQSKAGFSRIVRLKKQLDAAGIDLIAERIESENTVRELLDYGIAYGQGWLFGKPDIYSSYINSRKAA